MSFDLYAWKGPRDLDPDEAGALLRTWSEEGADPNAAPFEPSSDVGWFHRELLKDRPGLDVSSDGVGHTSAMPMWLETTPAPPARLVAMNLSPSTRREDLESIFGLAAKYDLVLFDPREPRIHLPLEELAAYASATFWPRGAIQAFVAGSVGAGLAAVAWFLGIPVLSGLVVIVGGFMLVMAVYTFIHEADVVAPAQARTRS